MLTVDIAYILGVLCGDAYLSKNERKSNFEIGLNTIDKDFALNFKSKLEKTFNVKIKLRFFKPGVSIIRGKIYKTKKQWRVRTCSKSTYNALSTYGNFGTYKWRVPLEFISSDNEEIICSFLKGFIDSEATIRENTLEISSKNKSGLEEIRDMFSKIGVKRFYFYKDWKGVWKLMFHGKDNLLLVYKKIGFSIKRKQNILEKSIELVHDIDENKYWESLILRKEGLTYKEISEITGINKERIRNWTSRGNIPHKIRIINKLWPGW
jgi:hypothetical protein